MLDIPIHMKRISRLPFPLCKGLNSFQLKIIALVFMTLGHSVMFLKTIVPFVNDYEAIVQAICRFSALLFLYIAVESGHHTRSKGKFLLRLYLAGLIMGLINFFLTEAGLFANFRIFFTLFYTLLFSFLLEGIWKSVKDKSWKHLVLYAMGIVIAWFPHWLSLYMHRGLPQLFPGLETTQLFTIINLVEAIIPSPMETEYQFLFIVMGVVWYLVRGRIWQMCLFTIFCGISLAGNIYMNGTGGFFGPFYEIFLDNQYWMILALPFIWLYNGQRGRKMKTFFYLYYPLHLYLLIGIAALLGGY
ncbi:MAG: TraX family protein [Ruminiclostridium sp.]